MSLALPDFRRFSVEPLFSRREESLSTIVPLLAVLLLLLIFRRLRIGEGKDLPAGRDEQDSKGDEAGSESLSVTTGLLRNDRLEGTTADFGNGACEAAAATLAVVAGVVESDE